MLDVLVRNRATRPAELGPTWSRRATLAVWAAQALVLGWVVYSGVTGELDALSQSGDLADGPLDGLWEPDRADAPWASIGFAYGSQDVYVADRDGHITRFDAEADADKATVTLHRRDADGDTATLQFERPDADHLVLRGRFYGGVDVALALHRRDVSAMPLLSRGFHWITEVPFNQ